MKKTISIILAIILVMLSLGLTGCGRHTNSYKAFLLIRSNTSKSASMSFDSLEGRMVFKLKNKGGSSGTLNYSASLDSGDVTVYLEQGGKEIELFSLSSGDSVESSFDSLEKGKIYIIVETDGKCKDGKFNFDIEDEG